MYDSSPWRAELLRCQRELIRLTAQARETNRRSALIEKNVMIAAFIMRKLDESAKLSNSWQNKPILCKYHALRDAPPDLLNWHRITDHYIMDSGKQQTITAHKLCNFIVHSFVFMEVYEICGKLSGVLINSDRSRRAGLWFVQVEQLCSLISETAADQPSKVLLIRDSQTGDWKSWRGHGE